MVTLSEECKLEFYFPMLQLVKVEEENVVNLDKENVSTVKAMVTGNENFILLPFSEIIIYSL